jgi:cytochrome c oxidase assembly protein subunit 15
LAATLFLIFVGGLVTSTGSALSVPDWPLSYGMLMPPMVGGVFYEHGHRMVASGVGLLTLILAIWSARQEQRSDVRRLAWTALGLVSLQGILGGITVRFYTPLAVSVAHGCLAQVFLCVLVALTYRHSREWVVTREPMAEDAVRLRRAAAITAAAVFVQLVVGAVMRHAEAGLAIPDFPLAFGRLVPPLGSAKVAIHFAHRVGAVVVTLLVMRLAWRGVRSGDRRFSRPALALAGLTLLQLTLGATIILTQKAVYPTTFHVAVGAAILATSFFLAIRAAHLLRPTHSPLAQAPTPALAS